MIPLVLVSVLAGIQVGCYQLYFKPQDKDTVRSQLHIPRRVRILEFDSTPKEAGWFGREGLILSAVFQFSGEEFDEYLAGLNDTSVWTPVSFNSYSPSLADSFSDRALTWTHLPLDPKTASRISRWSHQDVVSGIRKGMFYCCVYTMQQGERVELEGGGSHYQWLTRGVHGSEVPAGSSAVIVTVGVLDLDLGRLFAYIAFSG